ncbi:MAG TPA: ABC transporter ATP-binding protein [Chthoniobacterales bacterium]
MDDQHPALRLQAVSKSFGGTRAVRSVSLAVPNGERRALIGPNGAGKTTLFNAIAGEFKPDEGTIELFGIDITHKTIHHRARLGLGRTYQISQLFLNLTVEQNLFLAAAANRGGGLDPLRPWRNRAHELETARETAMRVGIAAYLPYPVSTLAHGTQRQLEIGMALAMRPRLIILDEPAAGLSPAERAALTELVKALPRDLTLILIEHDMEIVLEVADRITVLQQGSVLAEGTPAEVRSNQAVQEVYLGNFHA